MPSQPPLEHLPSPGDCVAFILDDDDVPPVDRRGTVIALETDAEVDLSWAWVLMGSGHLRDCIRLRLPGETGCGWVRLDSDRESPETGRGLPGASRR